MTEQSALLIVLIAVCLLGLVAGWVANRCQSLV